MIKQMELLANNRVILKRFSPGVSSKGCGPGVGRGRLQLGGGVSKSRFNHSMNRATFSLFAGEQNAHLQAKLVHRKQFHQHVFLSWEAGDLRL